MAENKGYSIDVTKKKCVSPECRGSYVHILEPEMTLTNQEDPDSKKIPVWNMQCIFPKSPTVNKWVEELKQIYAQTLTDKFDAKKAGEIAKIIMAKKRFPLRDGDNPADTIELKNAEQLEGCYFLTSKNKFRQPHIIGVMGKAVDPETLTPDDIYSGAWYRAMLEFWYYDVKGNKGISTTLVAVMKTKDGDSLGGGTSKSEATTAFSDFAEEAASMFTAESEESVETPEETKSEKKTFDFL